MHIAARGRLFGQSRLRLDQRLQDELLRLSEMPRDQCSPALRLPGLRQQAAIGVPAGPAVQHQFKVRPQEDLDHLPQTGRAGQRVICSPAGAVELLGTPSDDALKQLLLAVEMIVDQAERDPRPCGHIAHRNRVETRRREKIFRRIQYRHSGLLAAAQAFTPDPGSLTGNLNGCSSIMRRRRHGERNFASGRDAAGGKNSRRRSRSAGRGEREQVGFLIGTDVGGTFTDVWVATDDGEARVFKSPTTRDVLGGVLDAITLAAQFYSLSFEEFCGRIERFGHGTTVGLNALLTGHAARTAVLTTRGFGDTLEIGRLKRQTSGMNELERTDAYLRNRVPPLVPRDLVLEVDERIDVKGTVIKALDAAE